MHTMDAKPILSYEVPEVREEMEESRKRVARHAQEKLAEYQAEGARRKVPVECVLDEGGVPESLVRIADEKEVDFIIPGLRKKSPIARALLGSTAEPVIRAAQAPVLSVPIDMKVNTVEESRNLEVAEEREVSS
jgi:nucleotide-binding universal stress UspA family protein